MKYVVVQLFLLIALNASAQPKKQFYRFSEDIAATIEKDTTPWKYQMGATHFSIAGFYSEALAQWDKNGGPIHKLTADDSLYFDSFRPVDAKDYIIDRSKNEKLIIINEAHHNAMHRVFTNSLLQGLYDNGFTHFGLEALADTLINNRGYVTSETGYYTNEPQFANLINDALAIGFTVFGYEASKGANGKQREIEQAKNIQKMISQNPTAKFLIHCGWDHVIEGTPGNKSWEKAMARRLKESTTIDPFTIDQTYYCERGAEIYNHPYIQMVNQQHSVIMLNDTGKTFNGSATADQTDCRIIHPRTKFVNGRPNWLTMNGMRKSLRLHYPEMDFPVLVTAYNTSHGPSATPADVIEINAAAQPSFLVLPAGNYKIVVRDKNYNVVREYLETIQ